MRQRISHMNTVSRLVLVVLVVLGCQGVAAQCVWFDDMELCCPAARTFGEVGAIFEFGTTRERVEEIAAELGLQVNKISEFMIVFGPIARFCAPIGEEESFVETLSAFPEVRAAGRGSRSCGDPSYPPCECCLCDLDCPSLPACDPEYEIDADSDTFPNVCDTCTDTDGDGFGDPGFETDPTIGAPLATCPTDNCPHAFNQDQADLDSDGIGDECDRRLTVCHFPPGNPARAVTITIAQPAFPAHLAHGDVPGACVARRPRR